MFEYVLLTVIVLTPVYIAGTYFIGEVSDSLNRSAEMIADPFEALE